MEKKISIHILKTFVLFLSISVTSAIAQNNELPEGYPITNRTKTNLNIGWKFHLGEVSGTPEAIDFDDSKWEKVSVPHTLQLVSYEMDSIGESWVQKKYLRDFGWYRKTIVVKAKPSEKVFLEFEGVHNVTELWVNGKKVGTHEINGYIPFHFDISNYVKFNQANLIVVKADNRFNETISPDPHRSDYVKFGGLYRDVYLVTTNKLHVSYNWEKFDAGVHITTPTVNKRNGTVSIKTTVTNENSTPKKCKIETRIINAKGYVLKKITQSINIAPNSDYTFRQTSGLEDEDFRLWSPDTPYLYRVNSVIYDEEKAVDFVENSFGFRTFKLVKGKGFVLNGEPIFLIGVNRHQNYPNIGDAVPNSFHYNEALQYKKAGMNIIRLSHYTQDDAFIKACDELGMLVYEEPPTWIEWGDDVWFSKLESATRTMIRNHRNHPSIIFWGAGINHRGPVPRMQYVAKEEDPFRLTASASSPWNGILNAGITDVYATMDYRRTEFTESDFEMVMEHGSSPNAEVNQFHISRYKGSKQNIAAIAWLGADYNHLLPNDDRWTRDYMTNYAVLSSYRVPKPVYYWYQSELIKSPIVHIADETASKNGKVRVYSNCQEVALYHNGKLIGIQKPDNDITKVNLDHPSYTFLFNWKEGNLRAEGLNNGQKITEHIRKKEGKPHHIEVNYNINDQPFYGGGSDIRLAHAYVVDKNGEVVTSATHNIQFTISGDGNIIDNGKINANPARLYNGVASIYIKANDTPGSITVTAKSKGLQNGSATISTSKFNPNEIQKNAKPIFDYPIVKTDIGGEKQLVQHEWLPWTGKSDKDLIFKSKLYGELEIKVNSNDSIKWHGNSSVSGELGFIASDGLYTKDGKLILEISNLKKGNYCIETYHHAAKKDTKITNEIEVVITDANGKIIKKADDHIVAYYNNETTGERKPLFIRSNISSDGKTPINLEFKNLKKDGDLWLNGLVLKQRSN
ncbi:glycoside hydrolase family 2 protein [Aquimarina algiphila]|uniref:glycoside hydrolase family 2 protein n=1 Tax=Aquimarina algiphila TaxID=2047982 RepID=UPI00232F17CD|nr:glycoside hydrolase family 2 TIM barrel-domain containing protein [Aquimarina algiphila]